jgi:hypothetical protein
MDDLVVDHGCLLGRRCCALVEDSVAVLLDDEVSDRGRRTEISGLELDGAAALLGEATTQFVGCERGPERELGEEVATEVLELPRAELVRHPGLPCFSWPLESKEAETPSTCLDHAIGVIAA